MARKNASLGVNEMWWVLLCRVIHPLGAQWLWGLSPVSSALLDYAWVIFGQKNLWCLIQGCYWNLHVRGTLWQQDPQAPKPCTRRSPYQVQRNLLSTDRTFRDMWCCADQQGVVRVWKGAIQLGSPGVGDPLLVVDSVAKVGFSSKLVQEVRLTLDVRPSLLQAIVALASVLSCDRSDAGVLKGVLVLLGVAQSMDEEVLAEFLGLHLRRRDDQVVSKAATRAPDNLTSRMWAALAVAVAQGRSLSVSLVHLCLLPSLDWGHSCLLSRSTMVKILGLAVEMEISRFATVLARQKETRVLKHVDNLVHAVAHKGAPLRIRDCVDGCDALSKDPVVAARQTAAVRYALFIVRGCAREGVFVSAIGFFVKWQLEVVKCLTGRERKGWMLLCRVIHLLGAQLPRVLSRVSGALLDYGWVTFGRQSMCLIQRCYWDMQGRWRLWAQDLQVIAVVGESRLVLLFLGGVLTWEIEVLGTNGYLMKARPLCLA